MVPSTLRTLLITSMIIPLCLQLTSMCSSSLHPKMNHESRDGRALRLLLYAWDTWKAPDIDENLEVT